MLSVSMDERRVRSRLLDSARAVPSHWSVFPTLVYKSQKLFSEVLLKYRPLRGSVLLVAWLGVISNLNVQRALVKDARATYYFPPSAIAVLPACWAQVAREPRGQGPVAFALRQLHRAGECETVGWSCY